MQYQTTGLIYIDTDNYMHALRTLDFWQHPSLFEKRFMLTNYPFGEVSHWTRLMDILMSLTALPFISFESIRNSIFYGGFIFVPIFTLGCLYILHKLGIELLDIKSRIALYMMLLVQSQFMMVFKYNRPDHHAVIIFLASWIFYLCYLFTKNKKTRTITSLACVTALSLWLAVEGFILYLIILAFLYLGYIFFNYAYKDLQKFALTYCIFTLLCLCINPPFEGYLFFDNERLSILHITIALVIYLILYLGSFFKTKTRQFIFFLSSASLTFAYLWFHNIFTSPLSPEIYQAFTSRISEMHHGTTIYYLNYPLLGLIFLWLNKKNSPELRVLLACFLLPYIVLSLWATRFLAYADLFATLAIALWIHQKNLKKASFILLTLLLCATEIISFTVYVAFKYDLTKPLEEYTEINMTFFTQYTLPQGTVVSEVFITPYILWYTHQPVVASPYHRNTEGIMDNHNILFSEDTNLVIQLIKKHHIRSILLPLKADKNYYTAPEQNCNKLYGKMLSCHNYPDWLKEHPNTHRWGYVLLEVIPEKLP